MRPHSSDSTSSGKAASSSIVGLFGGDITLSLPLIPIRAITIQGSYTGSLGELKELTGAGGPHQRRPIPFATRPFSEANAALEDLRAGRVIGRSVLAP